MSVLGWWCTCRQIIIKMVKGAHLLHKVLQVVLCRRSTPTLLAMALIGQLNTNAVLARRRCSTSQVLL